MRSWSSVFSSTALKWKGIKFRIAFPSVLWGRFWMRSSASLRCQASVTQQTTLICAAASSWWPPPRACLSWRRGWSPTPGFKIESATRLSLTLANDCHKSNGSSYIMDELDVPQPTYMATSDPNLSKLSSYLTSSSWLMERRWIQLPHAIKKYRAKTGSTQNWPTNFNFCFPSSP